MSIFRPKPASGSRGCMVWDAWRRVGEALSGKKRKRVSSAVIEIREREGGRSWVWCPWIGCWG